ncbi:MAG: PfkB family carbohydrate kinase [Oscillospiraceae bacterium]
MGQQHVLCISDITCLGRCSLSSAIPVMSALGITAHILPSFFLTALPNIVRNSPREELGILQQSITTLMGTDINFDAISVGYLLNESQINACLNAFSHWESTIKIVDPVLGDNGKIYSHSDENIVKSLQRLCSKADIITPNLTESSALLGLDLSSQIADETALKDRVTALASLCPQSVITGVPLANGDIYCAGFCKENGYFKVKCNYLPVYFPGTGDLFTAVLTALMVKGEPLKTAVEKSVRFVEITARETQNADCNPEEGLWIEKTLPLLFSGEF